jgi:D-amino-acid dehydrogenase
LRVAVVGAGVVGVTCAFELVVAGHDTTVYERRGSVAAETSYANAGVLAPGYVTPWAAPGMPLKVISQLLRRHAPVRLGGLNAVWQLPWMWRWWRACAAQTHLANRSAMHRLATFSRQRLLELTTTLGLEYEQSTGYTVLLRDAAALDAAQGGLALLREWGVRFELLDAAACRRIEPGLNPQTALQGAIHLPSDGVGNCRHFAHLLRQQAQDRGAQFVFDTTVRGLTPGQQPALQFQDCSSQAFDAVVVCAGVQANDLLKSIGLRLPLAPVYGYSVTAPLRPHAQELQLGPVSALMDERFKVAISRLGRRIRVAGSAEIGGHLHQLNPAPLRTLYRVLDDWFPGAMQQTDIQQWKGARPMLPDGPPVLGESGAPGVWLNLGHGSSGWALACGSARVLAERISGRAAPVDLSHLTLQRLQR